MDEGIVHTFPVESDSWIKKKNMCGLISPIQLLFLLFSMCTNIQRSPFSSFWVVVITI